LWIHSHRFLMYFVKSQSVSRSVKIGKIGNGGRVCVSSSVL
jgi:hypothetical protein